MLTECQPNDPGYLTAIFYMDNTRTRIEIERIETIKKKTQEV